MKEPSHAIQISAIDIGSSAIRMDIAEVRDDGSIILLDSLKKGVQLGKDTFTRGMLSEDTMRAACEALRDFKKVMDTYGVARYRAVATSAVRESANSDTFLDRILMSTGLDVEIIDGPEENRLTYSAILESLGDTVDLGKGKSLIVEVSGGSTDVTILDGDKLLQSGTFGLGSIRLRAELSHGVGSHDQQVRLMKRKVSSFVTNIRRAMDLKEAVNYIAVGGDVRFVASVLLDGQGKGNRRAISRDAFLEFVDAAARLDVNDLVKKYSVSYLDAETLVPALWTYLQLLKETKSDEVVVSDASIRSGILLDTAAAAQGRRRGEMTQQTLSAARSLGRKFQYDEAHAERVRELAELIFDELRSEQRMTATHRFYLQVAALLHDIGLFVSPRSHHKHSYYLISASELFGLHRDELKIIANIARYHRKALPQRSHVPFVSLDRDERMVVSKLAAILRVANALDKEHLQKVTDLKVVNEKDQIVLVAQNASDVTMERMALADSGPFFSQVFGKQIVLREVSRTP